jgi:phosphohistidine phosphatase
MLTLMLLRHAKSDWPKGGQADIDRPLNERGERAAKLMGRYMGDNGLLPDLALCSPARRTKQTCELAMKELATIPEVRFEQDIYSFSDGSALLKCLRRNGGAAQTVLLVGHNPAIAGLALKLAGMGDDRLHAQISEKYPTAALAVITFEIDDWAALAEGAGTLLRFVRPRDLIKPPD